MHFTQERYILTSKQHDSMIPSARFKVCCMTSDKVCYCTQGLFTIYIKNPSGKSRAEQALSISHKIGKNGKYIVKGLEIDGKPSKM